jgi:hypothetical protein
LLGVLFDDLQPQAQKLLTPIVTDQEVIRSSLHTQVANRTMSSSQMVAGAS